MTKPECRRPLAARLIDEVLRKSSWKLSTLASTLGLTESQLEEFRNGARRMPVEEQLGLAAFVIKQFPECTRTARRLINQANAESAFLRNETATHMVAPPSRWR